MLRASQYLRSIKDFFTRASIRNPDHWFNQSLGRSSHHVSKSHALKVATVYACNKILSETIATLPFKFYERTKDGGREEYSNYFLAKVFKNPNILQTRAEFFEHLVTNINFNGNNYAAINYDRGYIKELLPMDPLLMTPEIKNNKVIYTYNHEDGPIKEYPQNRIFHCKNLTLDALNGISPIAYAKKSINLSLEAEDHGYTYFKNGARASGFLEHPAILKGKALENLQKSMNKGMTGDNKFKIRVLEEGMSYKTASLTNEDSQYLQTREFQVRDIARWYSIPLELLQEPSKTGVYTNREQFMQSFVVFTCLPWLVKTEQRVNTQLIPLEDQDNIYAEFSVDGLLRGDIVTRYRAYAIGRQWGILNVDEIRAKENKNPLPNGAGKKYLMPLNMEDVENPRKSKENIKDGQE